MVAHDAARSADHRRGLPDIWLFFRSRTGDAMRIVVGVGQEEDGRWIPEVPDRPGVLTGGETRAEAIARAQALALRVLADRLEHGETVPELGDVFAVVA